MSYRNRERSPDDDLDLDDERNRSPRGRHAQDRGHERGEPRGSYGAGNAGPWGSQGSYRQDSEGGWGRQVTEGDTYSGSYGNRSRGGNGGVREPGNGGSWGGQADARDSRDPRGSHDFSGGRSQARGPHSGKGPKGYQRSDERLKEEISDRLTDDGEIDASEIEVDVEKGVVTLRGTIDSRDLKWRIESLCDGVSGVQDVQNQLRVQRSSDRKGGNESQGTYRSGQAGSGAGKSSASGSSSASSGSPGLPQGSQGSQGRKSGSSGNSAD